MKRVQDSYLGWELLTHLKGCKQPSWEVSVRLDDDAPRYHSSLAHEDRAEHGCKDEHCTHRNRFDALVVRVVCRSCGMVEMITGEQTEDTGRSTGSTRMLGYGLPPRRVAGLLLWPGEPWLNIGRANSPEPHDFLVTATGVKRVTKDVVLGQITQGRGRRGGVNWTGSAGPNERGAYGYGLGQLSWDHAQDGFKTPAGAAKWVAARLAEAVGGAQ